MVGQKKNGVGNVVIDHDGMAAKPPMIRSDSVTVDAGCAKEGADAPGQAWVHERGGRTRDSDASL